MTKKSNEILIFERGEIPWTNSLDISEKFDKRHQHVVKSIEKIIKMLQKDDQFFRPILSVDLYGREQKTYEMSDDGFALLVMGFTGKKAFEWKVKYIYAFREMRKCIKFRKDNASNPDTQLARLEGKITRRALTDAIAIFIEYAREQGSSQPQMYYQVISKLSNRLFDFNESLKKNPHKRDYMESVQLKELDNIEEKLAQQLLLGMKEQIAYKSIYLLCKDKVERYIDIFGTSPVISQIEHTQYSLLN
jgi:Rha family phage regulatory protein